MKTGVSFEKFKELIQAIEKAKLKYVVVGGYAIEGRRRKHSRNHHDIDIMFLKEDEAAVEKLAKDLHYSAVEQFDNNYHLKSADGTRLDFYLVDFKDDHAVSKGKEFSISFPVEMMQTDLQKGTLDGFIFTIPSDSFLKKLAIDARDPSDGEFASTLLGDPKKMGHIKRIPRMS